MLQVIHLVISEEVLAGFFTFQKVYFIPTDGFLREFHAWGEKKKYFFRKSNFTFFTNTVIIQALRLFLLLFTEIKIKQTSA